MRQKRAKQPIAWRVHNQGADGRKVLLDGALRKQRWLYHRLEWPYARSIFEDCRLQLRPVGGWTDPYEQWWSDRLFGRAGSLADVNAYGLCWTTSHFDEPAWRMAGFGKEHPIVRIKCRAEVLLDAGIALVGNESGSLYLGNVRYHRERTLKGYFRPNRRKGAVAWGEFHAEFSQR